MTAGTIVFWRHGQTDYNLNQRLQGQVDIPLNATGRMQAERASEYVAQYRPSRIVASDLGRAMATARFVGERVGLPVDADERLRERAFGEWEGLLASEISATWPEEYRRWRTGFQLDVAGAESRGEAGVRVAVAVREYAEEMADDETLLVVAHGACIAAAVTELLGMDSDNWFGIGGMDNCHWTVVGKTEREPGWRVLGLALGAPEVGEPGR